MKLEGYMSKNKSEFEAIVDWGVDAKNRRIYFGIDGDDVDGDGGAISWESVELAVRALHRLAAESNRPIEIHMSSGGGSSVDMIRLHDEILACPCKVIFVGGGMISSSATWIMACCDERFLHKNTIVLLHDGTDAAEEDRHTDYLIGAKESEDHMNLLYQIFADNSHMPADFYADVCQRDLWLTAEETIMLGLADKLIEPKKRGNLRRARSGLKNMPDKKDMNKLVKSVYKRIRRRRVPKFELITPTDECDPKVIVDESAVPSTTNDEAVTLSTMLDANLTSITESSD